MSLPLLGSCMVVDLEHEALLLLLLLLVVVVVVVVDEGEWWCNLGRLAAGSRAWLEECTSAGASSAAAVAAAEAVGVVVDAAAV